MDKLLGNSSQIKAWFESERLKLSGNGVWLQGGEPNTLPSEQFNTSSLRVLFVRLSPYNDVAAGITHSYLYQMACSVEGCYIDLAFLPPEQDEQIMKKSGIPLLVGTTSKEPASAFDVIAISNSVLQELVNLPALLKYSDIPLSRNERIVKKSPFILIGGSNSFTLSILHGDIGNGEGEGLVDGVSIGDGEQNFAKILTFIRDNKGLSRPELLKILRNNVTGFYDPSAYQQVFENNKLVTITHEADTPYPVVSSKTACDNSSECFTGGPVLYEGAGVSHVIVSAGCPSFCSFCKESWEQKPYRENSLERVLKSAKSLKVNMGLNEISLMTFNANTCSDVFKIVNTLSGQFDRVAIKSQRFDAIVNAPELLDLQFDVGKRTYTCAMEGISERLRSLLQKNLDEPTILKGIDLLMQRNMRQLKVFLILTGYENNNDIEEFKLFLQKIGSHTQTGRNKPHITFSFAVLFRAPRTPMQFGGDRPDAKKLGEMLKNLCDFIKSAGYEARISSGPNDAILSEYIAYADRRHTKILVEASLNAGARYRGEIDSKITEFWCGCLKKYSLSVLCQQVRTVNTVFPWDDIDSGISKAYLWQIWNNVNNSSEIHSCLAKPWGSAICAGCGACKTIEYRQRLHNMGPDIKALKLLPSHKGKTITAYFSFEIPEKWAYCNREFIKAAFARRLMLDSEAMADAFLKVDILEPNLICYGKAVAAVVLTKPVSGFKTLVHENDISNIVPWVIKKKFEETIFPVTMELNNIENICSYSREIDLLLSKYSLKNQKQRSNGWLNWQVNQGQAKKTGLQKLCLDETNGVLKLYLIKWPEYFMLNKLSLGRPFKVINIGEI